MDGLVGLVKMGNDFSLNASLPFVTFDDATVKQAVASPDSHFHGLPERVFNPSVERQLAAFDAAEEVCVASGWAADSVRGEYGVDAGKVRFVGLGANLVVDVRWRDWRNPRFLWVGRDWKRKGGPSVLRAFARIREKLPDARLDLVGRHPRVATPGVELHGPLDHTDPAERRTMIDLFRRATVFVMPSLYEPFGITYVEAGFAGTPSIGTTIGGAGDAVGPGGILVYPDDESELIDAMRLLSEPDTAREMGEKASAHSQKFTWEAVARRVLAALGPLQEPGSNR